MHFSSPLRPIGLGLVLVTSFSGCRNTATSTLDDASPVNAGSSPARLIAAKGTFLRLGSDDPQAALEERPGWTRLNHDFWMDTTEVTQKEFTSLLGRNPSKTMMDDLPVTNVTWFDAVLAANARSRRDGLDTVYRYGERKSNPDGSVWDLPGLSVDLSRDGWRLPTEAEWELAARAGSTSPYPWGSLADSALARRHAWFQTNSDGTVHPVGTLEGNAWGLHDMAGNVMEWVQDWKGAHPKDTLDDFSGQVAPGEIADVPVKGGAYNFGITHLRPSNRSSTYASGRAARTEYVGFRLARGAAYPTFADPSGSTVQVPAVTLLAPDLASRLSVRSARLVFLNRSGGKGVLSWIDFGESSPVVRYLPDSLPVFHPVISPDGKWVAWSTTLEGSTTPSRIRARRLTSGASTTIDLGAGAIPRWWTDGSDTFLIRAEAMDNTSSGWKNARTTMNKWSGGALDQSEQILSQEAFHDGRSGHFLYTGYRRLVQHDLTTGKDLILFTAPQNGKNPGDTSQVCNASTAADASGRVLFLDFGFGGKSSVVGRPYGIHEVAFVADSNGQILQILPAPAGEQQWDHLEWSNLPRWAVASVQNATGANHAVHLLDAETGSSFPLVTGEDLWQPGLWLESPGLTQGSEIPDSAGGYRSKIKDLPDNPYADNLLNEAATKLALFWWQKDSLEYAFVGSSRVAAGICRKEFSSRTFNWGISGSHTLCDVQWVRNYLLRAPKLKVVGLSLMPAWLLEEDGLDYWTAFSNSVGMVYDSTHYFWRYSPPTESFRSLAIARSAKDISKLDSVSGEWNLPSAGWGGTVPRLFVNDLAEARGGALSGNMKILREISGELRKRGILLIMINFPQTPVYKHTPYAGLYGPTWSNYQRVIDSVRSLEGQYDNFHLFDAYNAGTHSFDSLDFVDESHLSHRGGVKLSRRLDSAITVWRANSP